MTVLDRLYHLEVEFHRHFRSEAINAIEAWSIHTSYALQQGYEPLLKTVGTVDVKRLSTRSSVSSSLIELPILWRLGGSNLLIEESQS